MNILYCIVNVKYDLYSLKRIVSASFSQIKVNTIFHDHLGWPNLIQSQINCGSYSANSLLADHALRTQCKFLLHFEANQGGNGLDHA